jgi:hypothetical protein
LTKRVVNRPSDFSNLDVSLFGSIFVAGF